MSNVGTALALVGLIGTWYFVKRKKDNKKRNISIVLLVAGITLVGIFSPKKEEPKTVASETKQTTETVKKKKTYEDNLKDKFTQGAAVKKDDNNLIIDINTDTDGNIFLNIGFPKYAAEALDIVKGENFDNVIVRMVGGTIDSYGNEKKGVYASAMFSKDAIEKIKFNTWIDQVTGDSTPFYELSSAYYILPSLFDKSNKKIVKTDYKASDLPVWVRNRQ